MLKHIKNKSYQLLRKSEKWTKTDMVYLAKNSFWLTLSKIIGTITALGLAVAYANLLPKETYATYKYILSIVSLFAISSLPGMENSLMRSVTLGFEGSFKQVVKTKFKWSLFGSLTGILISGYYFYQHNAMLGIGFLVAALTTPIINSLVYGPYLQGKKQFKTISIYNTIKQIILAIAIITAIWFSPKVLTIIIIFYGLNFLIQTVFFFITYKKYPPNTKKDPKTISFGKHLSLMNVLGVIAEQADKIILWHFLGATQLAIYSFATLPIVQAQSFLKSIPTIAFPKIATQDITITKKTLPKKIAKFMAILIIPVAIYIISAPYIFKILFPQYMDAVKYSQLFSLTLLFFPQRLLSQILIAQAKTKILYFLKIINPLIKITLYILLIYLFNIYGSIIATILSSLISGSLLLFFSILNNKHNAK